MPRVKSDANSGDGILAVSLALRLIETLATAGSPLGVTELATKLGATNSRIYRHLATLEQEGYVAQDAKSEKYKLGPRIVALAQTILGKADLIGNVRPVLTEIRDKFGHTTVFAQLEGEQIRILDAAVGTTDYAIMQRAGSILPSSVLHCSALGKIALAFGPEQLLQKIVSRPLKRRTDRTVTNPQALIEALKQVRKNGWASVPGEWMEGLNALAAPVFDSTRLTGMLGVIAPTHQLPAKPPSGLVSTLRSMAQDLSRSLGAGPVKEAAVQT
jgi:DNA-binding IclR family transcriptional regulator